MPNRAAPASVQRPSAARAHLARGLAQMMNEADVLVVMTDLDGRVLAWNRALAGSMPAWCCKTDRSSWRTWTA